MLELSTMTSDNQRVNDQSIFTSKTPHFFKIILEETIREGKLGIPRKFVRNHGKHLPSSIKLEVPSGAKWQVELTKSDGMVWLQKGWKEFAEHYSLEFGHFLVFRYEGNGHFQVLIFDKSASEIEYPCTSHEDDDGDDLPVEISEDVSASRKSKEKSHLPCPRPHKKMRIDSPNQPATDLSLEILSSQISADRLGNRKKVDKSRCSTLQPDGVPSPATKGAGGITASKSVETEVLICTQRLTANEKVHADRIASAFKSTGNPAFMVVMRPSFVRYRCKMVLPSDIGCRFLKTQNGNLTLCDSTGKTWHAKFFRSSENKKPFAQIHGGWRAFVQDNNLNVGDICVFELIKQPGILLKVVIHRPAIENANRPPDGNIASRFKNRTFASDTEANCRHSRCPSSSREHKDPKFKENENVDSDIEILDEFLPNQKTKKKSPSTCFQPSFISPNPCFTVVMRPSYVRAGGNPNIPCDFARKYFKKRGDVTLRVPDGRTWSVDYKTNVLSSYLRCNFRCNSWRAFALDNNLKVGDICVFELKENGRFLEVHFSSR